MSYLGKSGVSHTSIIHSQGYGQNNSESSEYKINEFNLRKLTQDLGDPGEQPMRKQTKRVLEITILASLDFLWQLSSGAISSPKLSNDKIKQFSNEFDVLYSTENNP